MTWTLEEFNERGERIYVRHNETSAFIRGWVNSFTAKRRDDNRFLVITPNRNYGTVSSTTAGLQDAPAERQLTSWQ